MTSANTTLQLPEGRHLASLDGAKVQNDSLATERAINPSLQNLDAFCEKLHATHPGKFQNLTLEKLQDSVCSVYLGLKGLPEAEKIKVLKTLLTQAIPSGSMEAGNLKPEYITAKHTPKGTLTIAQEVNGETTIESLARIANQGACALLRERKTESPLLLTRLVQQLTNSNSVDQGKRNTCSVTCSQSHQIVENPAVIAGRLADLITQGKSLDARTGKVALELTSLLPTELNINTLYQSAMMNAVDGGYDAVNDLVQGKVGTHPGLYARQLQETLNKSTGEAHHVTYQGEADYASIISQSLEDRKSVIAVVKGIGTGTHLWHDVRVVGLNEAEGKVYFINPWPDQYVVNGSGIDVKDAKSGLCSMSLEQFNENTQYIVHETNNPADFDFVPDGRDEVGGYQAAVFTVVVAPEDFLYFETLKRLREDAEREKNKNNKKSDFLGKTEKILKDELILGQKG